MLPRVPTLSTQCQPLLHPERAMGRQPIPTPYQAQRPVPGPRGPLRYHRTRRLPQQGQHRHRPRGQRHLVGGQGAHHQVRLGSGILQFHDQAGMYNFFKNHGKKHFMYIISFSCEKFETC